jgi:hypothetical protein
MITEVSKPKLSNNKGAKLIQSKETTMIKDVNEALKRLQVSLFKNIKDDRLVPDQSTGKLGSQRHRSLSKKVMLQSTKFLGTDD